MHAKTRPHMHVRAAGALSCEAVCGATGERVLATPVSRRPLERPSPRRRGATPMSRSRLMPPGQRTARGGHTPERELWGLLVFRAARSRAGLCAGDLSVLAEGPRFDDGR